MKPVVKPCEAIPCAQRLLVRCREISKGTVHTIADVLQLYRTCASDSNEQEAGPAVSPEDVGIHTAPAGEGTGQNMAPVVGSSTATSDSHMVLSRCPHLDCTILCIFMHGLQRCVHVCAWPASHVSVQKRVALYLTPISILKHLFKYIELRRHEEPGTQVLSSFQALSVCVES